MKVILLAAGRSKRLKPILDKNFLHFLGKPLVQLQMEQLMKAGLREFIIVGGKHNLAELKQMVKAVVPVKGKGGRDVTVKVTEQKNLDDGMAGAMLSVEKLVKSEPFLVVSANDVVDGKAYRLMLEAVKKSGSGKGASALMLGKKVKEYFPGGYLVTGRGGKVTGIVEKPGAGKEPSNLVNLVVHYYRNGKPLFEALQRVKSGKDDRYEVAVDSLLKQGFAVNVVPYDGFWQAVKYPWHVLDVMEYFLEKMPEILGRGKRGKGSGKQGSFHFASNVQISKTAVVNGNVYLEEGVKVLDNAVIQGPAYIGRNTVVATNALVRGSVVGANCVVGFGTEVARSYLGDNVWTHTNYIGDSIIGNNCSFGSGTVTGNLRLDEGNIIMSVNGGDEKLDSGRNKLGLVTGDNVRAGINTSFMPGIRVGSDCMIGAGVVVAQDVSDGQFVYGKMELVMKPNRATLNAGRRAEMRKKL